MAKKTKNIAEFGDFQTPDALAGQATTLLRALDVRASSIIEPTCGRGSFLHAAVKSFGEAKVAVGFEINPVHLDLAKSRVLEQAELHLSDFFQVDWDNELKNLQEPILIIGNPPWVTSSELGSLSSANLPSKTNLSGHRGIDAITGKSNFDISEWMLLSYLDWLEGKHGTIAVLCKTAVARKILAAAWKRAYPITSAYMFQIDALAHFGAAVDACFFVLKVGAHGPQECALFADLTPDFPINSIGNRQGLIATDLSLFKKWEQLLATGASHYNWRSGIKHDCSNVMELSIAQDHWRNGLHEEVRIEDTYVYPMYKSSDVGNGRTEIRRSLIVTQRCVGENTQKIESIAPRTWEYLLSHAESLDSRGSSIYRRNPRFAIFGVGEYSFAPWKVAISGFYKRLNFVAVGSAGEKPIMLDDTINFLPCYSEREAMFIRDLLNSEPAREFLQSMITWSDKRPITIELLRRLSIQRLARVLGQSDLYDEFAKPSSQMEFDLHKVA